MLAVCFKYWTWTPGMHQVFKCQKLTDNIFTNWLQQKSAGKEPLLCTIHGISYEFLATSGILQRCSIKLGKTQILFKAMQNKTNIQLWREQEQHSVQQCSDSIQRCVDRNNAQEMREIRNHINHMALCFNISKYRDLLLCKAITVSICIKLW